MGTSTQSGKKPAQKHKNSFAFVPNKYSAKALKIAATEIVGCCEKCVEIIEYKQRFGKYKPLTQPKTCLKCHLKKIKNAYHVICQECALEQSLCSKCHKPNELLTEKSHKDDLQERQEITAIMANMSERQRRTFQRKLDREDEEGVQRLMQKVEDNDEFDEFD